MSRNKLNKFMSQLLIIKDTLFDAFKILNHGIKNLITNREIYSGKLTIVTGSDFTHYKSLVNLLSSITKYESNSKIVVYNLGLEEHQIKNIKKEFTSIELINFEFDKYPPFISRRSNFDKKLGSYAWKPIIIRETLSNYGGSVLWLDAGDLLTKKLTFCEKRLKHTFSSL